MLLVLASNSPRRKELLAQGGWKFTTLPADINEDTLPEEDPQAYVLRLAQSKAWAAAARAPREGVVVAADTTVTDEPAAGSCQILGKPSGPAEAEAMLRQLRGHLHQVHTAVAVLRVSDGSLLSGACVTGVSMRAYSDEEIRAYIATGDPLDKAGAYAIQHAGFHPVDGIQGCYTNVIGLPLCQLARLLAEFGIDSATNIGQVCEQDHNNLHSVFREVFNR